MTFFRDSINLNLVYNSYFRIKIAFQLKKIENPAGFKAG